MTTIHSYTATQKTVDGVSAKAGGNMLGDWYAFLLENLRKKCKKMGALERW